MAVQYNSGCKTKDEYISDGFQVIESSDGTVSVFNQSQEPITAHETTSCCKALGYDFDIENQKCRWASSSSELFKVILNPQGNESALFVVEENDTCCIDVSFDYLFKFSCDALEAAFPTGLPVLPPSGGGLPQLSAKTATEEISVATTGGNTKALQANATKTLQGRKTLQKRVQAPFAAQSQAYASSTATYYGSDSFASKELAVLYIQLEEQEAECAKSQGDIDSGNVVPYVLECDESSAIRGVYCLTDAGVIAWKNILINQSGANGQENWDTWYGSDGSNTNTYNCTHVGLLIDSEPSSGLWISPQCNFGVWDRSSRTQNISKTQANIGFCYAKVLELEEEIAILNPPPEEPTSTCLSYVDMFENFNVSFTLEKLNESTGLLETVYEESLLNIGTGNLYDYIDATSGNTGIIISGDSGMMPNSTQLPTATDSNCVSVRNEMVDELMDEYLTSNTLPTTDTGKKELETKLTGWYQSCWLQYESTICDPDVIELIQNEKINMSISINDCCVDFSIMLDRIKLVRNCNKVDNVKTYISEAPKFNLRKVCDNKKSWIANKEKDDRDFELKYRGTEYDTNHHRLVINTKEVDLNLSPARAVESDVWCYINDNNCILEGCGTSSSGITTYSAFTCPSGYIEATDGDSCTKTDITGATDNTGTNSYTIGPGRFDRTSNWSPHKQFRGTIFVEDETTEDQWPIYWSITPEDTWVGPYYQCDYLKDNNGDYLTHTGFGNRDANPGDPKWFSPEAHSGVFSIYGYTTDGTNEIWGGSLTNRLLDAGIYTDPIDEVEGEWIGWSFCVEVDETKVYRVGFAADDACRLKINGKWLYNVDESPTTQDEVGLPKTYWWGSNGSPGSTHYPFVTPYNRDIQCNVVVGVKLSAGKNIFQVEGIQAINQAGSSIGFAMEVYDAPLDVLKNILTKTELELVTVFSTENTIGQKFNIGENSGYSCPSGYALDTCVPPPYQCVSIETVTRELQQKSTIDCCCGDLPLLAKDYDNRTVELPLNFSLSGTVDSSVSGVGFSCPVSYTAINEDTLCVFSGVTSYTQNAITYTAKTGSQNYNNFSYGGTRFYENTDNFTLPLIARSDIVHNDQADIKKWEPSSGGISPTYTELSFSSAENSRARLIDDNGTPLLFELVNNRTTNIPSPWSNPENGGTTKFGGGGRLMRAGVWTVQTTGATIEPTSEWIGFSRCITGITETKVYYLGFGADNGFRLKINGKLIASWGGSDWCTYSPTYFAGVGLVQGPTCTGTYVSENYGETRYFNSWHVIPITLEVGIQIIELEGWNNGGSASFGAEIYNVPDYNTLKYLDSISGSTGLEQYIVWSTKDRRFDNTIFDLGQDSGKSCPTGYALSCDKTECYDIRYTDIDGSSIISEAVPCGGISDLIDGFSANTTLQSVETLKCGSVYALGTWTGDTTFDGYWLATENDGSLGVYDVYYNSGTTESFENVSNQLDAECCATAGSAFDIFSDLFEQGVNSYPTVSWDTNKGKCVVTLCGDKGCIDLDSMLTTELSEIDTVKEFEMTLSSELIDVKSRQTISGYPTMRMLYDRYNMHALEYCDVQSQRFDYFDMDNFGQTVGNYWIDLIEQVVPATTIWGSTYTYKNTIFDTQKHAYKNNNTFICDDPSKFFPWSAITNDLTVDVITQALAKIEYIDISGVTTPVQSQPAGIIENCVSVWSMQHTCNSTFLGKATTVEDAIIPPVPCTLENVTIEVTQTEIGVFSAEALYGLPVVGPITFQWGNGEVTQTVTGLTVGTYNVVLVDSGADACTAFAETTITNNNDTCWYKLPEAPQHIINEIDTLGAGTYTQIFTMPSITINGETTYVNYTESMVATTGSTNIDWVSATTENGVVSGSTTGLTYTNYVDFLNNAFMEAGVYPDYHAQIATEFTINRGGPVFSGFFIVRPEGDTFELRITNDGVGSYDQFYSNDNYGVFLTAAASIVTTTYDDEPFECEGFVVDDGIVIELKP